MYVSVIVQKFDKKMKNTNRKQQQRVYYCSWIRVEGIQNKKFLLGSELFHCITKLLWNLFKLMPLITVQTDLKTKWQLKLRFQMILSAVLFIVEVFDLRHKRNLFLYTSVTDLF